MRGTYFNSDIEYVLEIQGEEWRQGDSLAGTLLIKNHGQNSFDARSLQLNLAFGEFKKVRAKDSNAWKDIKPIEITGKTDVPQGEAASFNWTTSLGSSAPITEKKGSLYILYGTGDDLSQFGNLQLNVELRLILEQFLKIFEMFHRFKIGTKKNKKGVIEVKMVPPSSREMGSIHGLNCQLALVDDVLKVTYNFTIKKLEAAAVGMSIEKQKQSVAQEISKEDYYIFGTEPNQEKLVELIGEAITRVKPTFIS